MNLMDIWYDVTSGKDWKNAIVNVRHSGRRGLLEVGAWDEATPLWRLVEERTGRQLGSLRQAISVTLDAEEPSASAGTSCVDASWLQPGTALAQAFKGFLNGRPLYQRSANFLHGLQLHRGYRNQKDFSTWAGKDHGLVSPQGQTPGWD